jgi:hypothetical protein
LEIDPRGWPLDVLEAQSAWGEVALVIRPRETEAVGGAGGEAL